MPTVHLQGGSAIRRPLIVLAVCAVGVVGYLARDFLIPSAGAVVLALMLTPVAGVLERRGLANTPAAGAAVSLLALVLAGLLAVAVPSISNWADQAPLLTYTLERKLEGLRKSLAVVKEMSDRVEQATTATPTGNTTTTTTEKVVVRDKSLLGQLASTTPAVVLQIGYAGVLAFMLLAHRNSHRRQLLRIPATWATRVRLARMMRDINDRVGHYLFALAVIYSCVAVTTAVALALLGIPNAIMWGVVLGLASFVPFVGAPVVIALVTLVALLSFDDWQRIVAVPVALTVIHLGESQFITPAFVSRRCALNTVAVFVAIALLGWMWGIMGAIVAVPLLILLSTIAAHLPSLRWLEVLLADDRPVSERLAVKPPLASVNRAAPQVRRRRVAAR
ncbi:MAG: AI-2E family transporter [Reyranella sp.]|nr:AI-2E family transporter [Reyranella sp.]